MALDPFRPGFIVPCALFVVGSLVGAPMYNNGSKPRGASASARSASFLCSPVWVHDGDTFTCSDGTRIRVAGVNAREIAWDGRRNTDAGCNPGAPCPNVDAVVARDRLASLLGRPTGLDTNGNMRVTGPALRCQANGKTYQRIAAFCATPANVDISCAMEANGAAARWNKFWMGRRC